MNRNRMNFNEPKVQVKWSEEGREREGERDEMAAQKRRVISTHNFN